MFLIYLNFSHFSLFFSKFSQILNSYQTFSKIFLLFSRKSVAVELPHNFASCIFFFRYSFVLPKLTSEGCRIFYCALKTVESALFSSQFLNSYQTFSKMLLLFSRKNVAIELPRNFVTCIFFFRYSFVLPKLTSEGYRIFYCALKTAESALFSSEMLYQHYVKLLTATILESGTCPGYIFIYDIKGFSFAHMAGLSISLTKKFINFTQVITYLYSQMFLKLFQNFVKYFQNFFKILF